MLIPISLLFSRLVNNWSKNLDEIPYIMNPYNVIVNFWCHCCSATSSSGQDMQGPREIPSHGVRTNIAKHPALWDVRDHFSRSASKILDDDCRHTSVIPWSSEIACLQPVDLFMLVRNARICDLLSHGVIDTHVTGAGSKGVFTWEPGGARSWSSRYTS